MQQSSSRAHGLLVFLGFAALRYSSSLKYVSIVRRSFYQPLTAQRFGLGSRGWFFFSVWLACRSGGVREQRSNPSFNLTALMPGLRLESACAMWHRAAG